MKQKHIWMPDALIESVNAWRFRQQEPPSFSAAVRHFVGNARVWQKGMAPRDRFLLARDGKNTGPPFVVRWHDDLGFVIYSEVQTPKARIVTPFEWIEVPE